MLETRMAVVGDAETIALHRVRMFADSGQADAAAMERMRENFVEWVRPRLADGRYVGWMVEEVGEAEADSSAALRNDSQDSRNDNKIVGGAGMWVMDFPPHWMDAEPVRAYLLNFHVAPTHRGQGLAERMLKEAVAEAGRRGIGVVSLHASKMGRRIYERNGFVGTNEMILRLGGAE
jgi:ribosomal protein S18 acetylase RimI-like enzyme